MISGDPIGTLLAPGERPRVHPSMVPFYRVFIPIKLAGRADRIRAARAALRSRDVLTLESILTEGDHFAG